MLGGHGPAGLASADPEAVSGRSGQKHRPAGVLPYVSARSLGSGSAQISRGRGLRASVIWTRGKVKGSVDLFSPNFTSFTHR